ncbi:probable helicase CHR10 isoform X3 [Pistacia vera]|uniref:probable helicase CHR10 isoform X3 n=1 Tax=Pistacia vera TaxID=55513 RepID=UPI0012630C59|nr:probable helicase CHR10 isoform X3 [Pistacia vera]
MNLAVDNIVECDRWLAVGVAKFTPKLKVLKYVGEKVHRCSLHKIMYEQVKEKSSSFDVSSSPFDILLTACAIALMVQDFQSQIPWYYAIIDESQRLENPSSILYKVLRERFVMPRRLLMTGTPIQNNLYQLLALIHFCVPSMFWILEEFLSTFNEAGPCLSGGHTYGELRNRMLQVDHKLSIEMIFSPFLAFSLLAVYSCLIILVEIYTRFISGNFFHPHRRVKVDFFIKV